VWELVNFWDLERSCMNVMGTFSVFFLDILFLYSIQICTKKAPMKVQTNLQPKVLFNFDR